MTIMEIGWGVVICLVIIACAVWQLSRREER